MSAKAITPEEVESEVARYWRAFTAKSAELHEFYRYDAKVFGRTNRRVELGRTAALSRERQFFHTGTTVEARITSPIEIMLIGDIAIAAYTNSFSVTGIHVGVNRVANVSVEHGRVTQVFVRDDDGSLRILHEHLSTADSWEESGQRLAGGAL